MSEQIVDIMSKLYSCRRSLSYLFADTFIERITPWQDVVRKVMAGKQLGAIPAMIEIVGKLEGNEVAQMWVMAAVVEMLEPSV